MIHVSQTFNELIKQHAREWFVKVDINGTEYGMDSIVDFEIQNDIAGSDEFAIGTAVFSKLSLSIRTFDVVPPNARIIPYVSLKTDGVTWLDSDFSWAEADIPWDGGTTDWLPLGVFYVDNREQIYDVLYLECYDGLVFADVEYISQLNYPATLQEIWDDICDQIGFSYDSSVQINPSYTVNIAPTGYTCRQVLSFIAGCHGASIKMTRNGAIGWRKFDASEQPVYEFTESDYNRVKQLNPVKTYTRLVVTYDIDENLTYEAGTGDENHTLYIENPFMTQQMVNDLLQQINGYSYVPIELDSRGYPQLEHGDRISFNQIETLAWEDASQSWDSTEIQWNGVSTHQSIILRQTLTFKGGLKMALEAPSVSEQESEFAIDGSLTAAVNRINQNAIKYSRTYYGVTHSKEQGIVVQRSDGLAKAVFNADELSFYADGERALWFDIPNKKFKFTGTLEGADGIFSGTVQAGTIISSIIQTLPGIYPRVEINPTSNLFSAMKDASSEIRISPHDTGTGTPTLIFRSQNITAGIMRFADDYGMLIGTTVNDITISASANLWLTAGTGYIRVPSWNSIYSSADGALLGMELNSKADRSFISGGFYVSSTPGGPADKLIIFTNGVITAVS